MKEGKGMSGDSEKGGDSGASSRRPAAGAARHWLKSDVRVLLGAREALLALAMVSTALCTFYYGQDPAGRLEYLYTPMAALFGWCLLSALWLEWRLVSSLFTYVQLTSDVGVVSAIVYISGGPASPFLFLYLPL